MPNSVPDRLTPGQLDNTIGYRLRLAQLAAYRRFEATLDRFGTAPRYFGLLCIIGHQPGQPQSRLAEAISVQRSSLVAIIDRLSEEGLVERRASPVDRRANAVWLTDRGVRVVAELHDRAEQEERRLAEGMTSEEQDTLIRLLGRIVDNLR